LPGLDEALFDELALHLGELVVEGRAARGLAARLEVGLGLIEEQALAKRVFAAVARGLDEIEALVDLALRIPVRAIELLAARERVGARRVAVGALGVERRAVPGLALGAGEGRLARITLVDVARAVAGHVAGARVHDGHAEVPRERDQVVDPERVDLERLVERRAEVDDARHVDHRVDAPRHLGEHRGRDAEQAERDVTRDGGDLAPDEGLEGLAGVGLAQRIEAGRGDDLRPEALVGRLVFLGPDEQVHVLELGEALEQHADPHLAEEAGAADHHEALAVEHDRGPQGRERLERGARRGHERLLGVGQGHDRPTIRKGSRASQGAHAWASPGAPLDAKGRALYASRMADRAAWDRSAWEVVLGLEVHAQLQTRTKLFCGCETSFGDAPNTHTCPTCLGLPGALPVLNRGAVVMATRAALALGCTVHEASVFARKNYFYPDLPKGYQISQYEAPLATGGALRIESPLRGPVDVGLVRIHMEEDAGKNLHGQGGVSLVDLNRAGTPLIEIVSAPDLRSGEEAADYLKRLRELLLYLGVCDGNLEQGSFRCDVNVSVRRPGEALGTRAELKNINSFRFVVDAVDAEVARQLGALSRGEALRQETRGYDPERRLTYPLREKEGDAGYRYFPDPDLPPLLLEAGSLERARESLPELPWQKRARYERELGLTAQAASVLTAHPALAAFFDDAVRQARALGLGDASRLASFVMAEVLRDVSTSGLAARFPASAGQVAELVRLVEEGRISGKQAKEVWAAIVGTGRAPSDVVRERGMVVLGDRDALMALARELSAESPKQLAQYRSGKTGVLGYFVGQMMKKTGGSADPVLVNEVLAAVLAPPATPGEGG
jgi:aspartyl-tRNA(Asn)/glutamyl-tRNA(Gln) amidotransferase subunit B